MKRRMFLSFLVAALVSAAANRTASAAYRSDDVRLLKLRQEMLRNLVREMQMVRFDFFQAVVNRETMFARACPQRVEEAVGRVRSEAQVFANAWGLPPDRLKALQDMSEKTVREVVKEKESS